MESENTDDAIMHLTDSKALQSDFGIMLSKAIDKFAAIKEAYETGRLTPDESPILAKALSDLLAKQSVDVSKAGDVSKNGTLSVIAKLAEYQALSEFLENYSRRIIKVMMDLAFRRGNK
jgi:hypothetical protein